MPGTICVVPVLFAMRAGLPAWFDTSVRPDATTSTTAEPAATATWPATVSTSSVRPSSSDRRERRMPVSSDARRGVTLAVREDAP